MGWIARAGALLRGRKLAKEHDEELRYHLAMLEERSQKAGLPAEEATSLARRRFGNVTSIKERMRDADAFTFVESFLRDIRFGVRMLLKHPGFTATAVLALAVGIGVNTAVFTVYKALLLGQLDAKDPGELVNIYRTVAPRQYQPTFSYPDFNFFREKNHVFTGLVATTFDDLTLTGVNAFGEGEMSSGGGAVANAVGFRFPSLMHGGAEYASALAVSENYFSVLGTSAIRGRVFLPQDVTELRQHPVALISENYWQRRFGGNRSVLGMALKLNGVSFTVMGVTPHDFEGTNINVPDFWLPMSLLPLVHDNDNGLLADRDNLRCVLFGRLARGVSLPEAQAEMTLLAGNVRTLHAPNTEGSKPFTITLTPGSFIGPMPVGGDQGLVMAILLITGATGLVLLIACANVANLQLARSAARQREMGVRLSIGASRGRIIRQLLTESVLLGTLAGFSSMLMAWWSLRILMAQVAASLPMEWGTVALRMQPDAGVFAFVCAVSVIAGVLFGLAPALEASRPDLSSALKESGARFGLRLSNSRLRDGLVGVQAAVCVFLLIGAGLLIRGSMRGMALSPGYETENVVALQVSYPAGFHFTHERQLAELRQLRERIRNLAGVNAVTSGNAPDGGGLRTAAVGLGGARPPESGPRRTVFYSYVGANYFKTLGIPLLSGQSFPGDVVNPQPVAVLSAMAAQELWPGRNPIGQKITLDASHEFHVNSELFPNGITFQVVGVVNDIRGITPGDQDAKKVYLPLPAGRIDDYALLVRSYGDGRKLLPELSKQVALVDGRLVVYADTLSGLMTFTPNFVISRLAGIFAVLIGVLGLLLACVGIYGAVSYAVVRRTREMGIRMALGAGKSAVLGLVLRESVRPVMAGLCVGIVAAAGVSRVLRALLFGMSVLDPVSFLGIAALFLAVALAAAYFPARRATLVDPMKSLRCD